MYVLVTYDVSTTTREGRRRLSRVAKACANRGQRVQNSVFECKVDPGQFAELRGLLLEIIEPRTDSIRFYFLGATWHGRVEHHGAKPTYDIEGPLIA
jgi:CRISPR-associated protein Cas2